MRQRDFVGGDAQANRVEVVDLRVDLDEPGTTRPQEAHAFRAKMQRKLGQIAPIGRRVEDQEIDGASVDAPPGDQGGQQGIAERGKARLVQERRPGRRIGLSVIADVRTQLFRESERSQASAAERDEECGGIIVVRAREGIEVAEIHGKFDAIRVRLRANAKYRDGQRSDQRNEQDDGRVPRPGSKKSHEACAFAQRRSFSATESQKGSP